MKWLRTTKVVGGRSAHLGGSRLGFETALVRNRGLERALAVVTVTALMMSLMIAFAPPALAHHPILAVSAVCDDQGNKLVTWKVSNGNWEGRTMTVDLVQYTDGVSGWANIVVGLALSPNGSASETVVYPLAETGTKTLTVRGDWSGGGSQNVSSSLSADLEKLKCDGSTTTTQATTTTTKATTTTTEGSTTTTEGSTTTTRGLDYHDRRLDYHDRRLDYHDRGLDDDDRRLDYHDRIHDYHDDCRHRSHDGAGRPGRRDHGDDDTGWQRLRRRGLPSLHRPRRRIVGRLGGECACSWRPDPVRGAKRRVLVPTTPSP